MPRALFVKELRETLWIALVALALQVNFVAGLMGIRLPLIAGRTVETPFVSDTFLAMFAWVAVGLALALGYRQSVGESARGTYEFLLHRPASRERLIGAKLLTGGMLYLVCSAVPILMYAWWAATPGTHAGPFEWSMTGLAWRIWISLTVLYLGSFLSGIRPGRWKATRLLPMLGAGLIVALICVIPWWPVFGLVVVVLNVLLVTNIFFVARTRDF